MTLAQYFRLIDIQARMLLKADSSKFILGYMWWFLEPLLWVAVFYLVFNVILDNKGRSGGSFSCSWPAANSPSSGSPKQ